MKRLYLLLPLTSLLLTSRMTDVAHAISFGQQDVEQSEFIAIARPYGNQNYDLLILRQLPGKRPCWQEKGSDPVLVDPLLLNFDFSGICERSTDSNGYSIRIEGQDYGLDYLLRIVERDGELLLIGTHRTDLSQPEITIGRTKGMADGFLKIQLNPGWKFTKRMYNGKILGHIYLTGDSTALAPATDVATSPSSSESDENPSSVRELTFSVANEENNNSPSLSQPVTQPASPLPPPSATVQVTPSAHSTLPPPPAPRSLSPSASTAFSDLPPLPVPTSVNQSSLVPPPTNGRKNLTEAVAGLSNNPSAPQGYRVMVDVNSQSQQAQVKSLFPDAFPTSYSGRSLWQVGLFSTRENAQNALQSLENRGLSAIIVP